ncbi:MATE family efflux transporter [Lysinibacillus fusiformis]|uniref:MATE family efflux transporter n=1 Tax=Lysinibacillus fusiformis TaxID=28031 RepID=UPI003CFC116D
MKNNWKEILKFSLPMTFIGIADLLLIVMDFIWIYVFVGKPETFGALRVSSAIIILVEGIIISVIGAIMVYVSQHFGAKDIINTKKGVLNGLAFSMYGGLAVTIIGIACMPIFELLFGVDRITNSYVQSYLTYFFIGYIFICINNLLLLLPRFFGEVKLIYKGLGLMIALNFIVTPLFMIICDHLNMDIISGAALGTIFANAACFLYLFYILFYKDYLNLGLNIKDMPPKIDIAFFKQNKAYVGTEIFNGLSYNTSLFLYTLILSYYPKDAFNIYSIGTYAYVFFGVFAQNFTASLIPMVAQRVGEGKYDEIKDLVKKMCLILITYGITIAVPLILSRNFLAQIFSPNKDTAILFSEFFAFYTIPWVLNLLSLVFVFVVGASGDAKGGSLLIVVNMYVIVVSCLLIVPNLFNNTITGVFFSLGLIQVLTFVFSYWYYLTGRWTKVNLLKSKEVEAGSI